MSELLNWSNLILCGLMIAIAVLFFIRKIFYIAFIAILYGLAFIYQEFIKLPALPNDAIVWGICGVAFALTISFTIDRLLYQYAVTDSAKSAQKRIKAKLPILGGLLGYVIANSWHELVASHALIVVIVAFNFLLLAPLAILERGRFLLKKTLWQLFLIFGSCFIWIATKSLLSFIVPFIWHFVILHRMERIYSLQHAKKD